MTKSEKHIVKRFQRVQTLLHESKLKYKGDKSKFTYYGGQDYGYLQGQSQVLYEYTQIIELHSEFDKKIHLKCCEFKKYQNYHGLIERILNNSSVFDESGYICKKSISKFVLKFYQDEVKKLYKLTQSCNGDGRYRTFQDGQSAGFYAGKFSILEILIDDLTKQINNYPLDNE